MHQSEPTGVSFPVEVLGRVAVTTQIQSGLFTGGTVSKGVMEVGDVVEEMNLILGEE